MKLHKDKTNTAVYEAMREALKHSYVLNTMDNWYIFKPVKPHEKGFYMDYMAVERMLCEFYANEWNTRIPQIIEELGAEKGNEIRERLIKTLYCKGIVYRKNKYAYHCHHPLCPICHHHKHYRTIKDLKPHLDADRNRLHLLMESEYIDYDQIHIAFEALEQRAKKVTSKLSPLTVQWSRQHHLRYDTEADMFVACYAVLAVSRKTDAEDVDRVLEELEKQGVSSVTDKASMDTMPGLLTKILYYDPLVLKYGGNRAFVEWQDKTPGFRYWAKVAHRK